MWDNEGKLSNPVRKVSPWLSSLIHSRTGEDMFFVGKRESVVSFLFLSRVCVGHPWYSRYETPPFLYPQRNHPKTSHFLPLLPLLAFCSLKTPSFSYSFPPVSCCEKGEIELSFLRFLGPKRAFFLTVSRILTSRQIIASCYVAIPIVYM